MILHADINALVQTNRHLYKLLGGYLYEHDIRYSYNGGSMRGIALFWAAKRGRVATAKKAIKAGAGIENRLWSSQTALLLAAANGQAYMVALLIENGANCYARDKRGHTVMQNAILSRSAPTVQLLVDHGMDPHDACENGTYEDGTPLHVASYMGEHEFMKLLLSLNFDVNARDHRGNTPLHWTVFPKEHFCQCYGLHRTWTWTVEDTIKTAKILLGHNADLEARNNSGLRPKE